MKGNELTPYRRKVAYDRALHIGAEDVEGGVDKAHFLVHGLAASPDGPLEVRADYRLLPEREWTEIEVVDAEVETISPTEPTVTYQPQPEEVTMFTAVVTVRGEASGTAEDFEAGLRARLEEFNGGAGSDMVYPEVLSVDVRRDDA